jgi:hypothetical protein
MLVKWLVMLNYNIKRVSGFHWRRFYKQFHTSQPMGAKVIRNTHKHIVKQYFPCLTGWTCDVSEMEETRNTRKVLVRKCNLTRHSGNKLEMTVGTILGKLVLESGN